MIRFRFAEFVPENGFGVSYVDGERATPEENISIIEPDEVDVANIVDLFGNETFIYPGTGYLLSSDVVLSNESIVSTEVRRPIKLYYKYLIGRGTYDFYCKDAEDASDGKDRMDALRSRITILDGSNNPTQGIKWDISYEWTDTNRYTVYLLVDKRCSHNATYKVRYPAISAGGSIIYNQTEVINAEPLIPETDYTTTYVPGTGYLLGMIGSGEMAPALALFGDSVDYNVTPTRIYFGGHPWATSVRTEQDTGAFISVEDLVADINALDLAVFATPLSSHEETGSLLQQGVGVASPEGTIVRFNNLVHVRYNEERRIFPELPAAPDSMYPWYPRVNYGEFYAATGVYEYYYKLRDFDYQPFSKVYGYPYRDMFNEEPTRLGRRMVQVSRFPIHSIDCMTCYVNGKEASFSQIVSDVDLQNGIVFLADDYHVDSVLAFSYAYRENNLEYMEVDLNPTTNGSIAGKFVGLYMLPHLLETATDTYLFERTVYHVIRDTYQGVLDALDGLALSDSTPARPVLLGVYNVVQKNDKDMVHIIDARVSGGGIKESQVASDMEEPEAEMFWDIGSWDGEPVQDRGTLIVEYPDDIIGDDSRFRLVPASLPIDLASGWLIPSGFYTEETVLAAAQKHTKAGALPILDPYTPTGSIYPSDFEAFNPSSPGTEWADGESSAGADGYGYGWGYYWGY